MAEVCEQCPTRSFISDVALLSHIETVHGADQARKPKGTAMSDTAERYGFTAPTQFRKIVETDLVNGAYVSRVVQDWTEEPQFKDGDSASLSSETSYRCVPCQRPFQTAELAGAHFQSLHPVDNAEALLTFDVIRDVVREALRVKHATPFGDRCWIYVADLSTDWVVYEVGSSYFKASYTLDEATNKVTFGDAVQVIPRMTYLEVSED